MGYLSDQKGIIKRYIDQEGAWAHHITNTKNYIIETVTGKNIDTVTILGSGWLLDVPLEFLSNNFRKIILIDINHPRQIRHKLRKFANVEIMEADISGAVLLVYELVKEYRKHNIKKDLREIEFPGLKAEGRSEYTISLNIINQLDILLVDYIKRFLTYDEEELNYFRGRIQKSHIDSLIPGKSCLIADYEEEIYDMDGNPGEKKNLVYTNLPKGKNRRTWQWEFDMSGSYYTGKKTFFNVIALEL